MSKPHRDGGIRHRNEEYNSRRGLFHFIIATGIIAGLIFFLIHTGIFGAIAGSVGDAMYNPQPNVTGTSTQPHTNPETDWRLSLNRNLDAKYTTHSSLEPIEVSAVQIEVMKLLNAQRAERDVEPLFWNRELSELNRWYAKEIYEMNDTKSFHNNTKTGRDSYDRATWAGYPVERCTRYGEVIIGPTYIQNQNSPKKIAAAITEGWMRSDSHREAILNEQYDVAGVGIFVAGDDTRIAVMTLCDRADIPDEELNGWEDAKYRGDRVAIPYEVAVAGDEWDSTGNLTETPRSTDADTASA